MQILIKENGRKLEYYNKLQMLYIKNNERIINIQITWKKAIDKVWAAYTCELQRATNAFLVCCKRELYFW